jgi:hypothetical protein
MDDVDGVCPASAAEAVSAHNQEEKYDLGRMMPTIHGPSWWKACKQQCARSLNVGAARTQSVYPTGSGCIGSNVAASAADL